MDASPPAELQTAKTDYRCLQRAKNHQQALLIWKALANCGIYMVAIPRWVFTPPRLNTVDWEGRKYQKRITYLQRLF